MEEFGLIHEKGRLYVVVKVNGGLLTKDVTEYFEKENAHDEWLDYRIGLDS
jgi:hypothetical protein